MSILTKNERKQVYELAANNYFENNAYQFQPKAAMCFYVNDACQELFPTKRVSGYELNNFPELKLFRPKRMMVGDNYWTNLFDVEFRVHVLLFCKEMCK
ncbi:MAG: hypothetical protein V4547_18210 [Bacteroidota bacterium]